MKIDGYTIITDPVFSTRAGLHLGPVTLGVKRLIEPALEIRELPKIDLVVLSHAHMDHFDIPSLRRLEQPVDDRRDGEPHGRSAAGRTVCRGARDRVG